MPAQPIRRSARRGMGGHAPVDPSTLPFPDNVVRTYLKEDWQVVVGILGLYTGIYLLTKLGSGGKKEEDAAVVVPPGSAFPPSGYKSGVEPGGSSVPSITDASFESWAKVPGNMEKWEAEISKM